MYLIKSKNNLLCPLPAKEYIRENFRMHSKNQNSGFYQKNTIYVWLPMLHNQCKYQMYMICLKETSLTKQKIHLFHATAYLPLTLELTVSCTLIFSTPFPIIINIAKNSTYIYFLDIYCCLIIKKWMNR